MQIVIDRVKILKALQTQLGKRKKAHANALDTFRFSAKAKALELVRKALEEIEAYDPEVKGRIPEAVTSPLPYDMRHAPNANFGELEYAIAVLQASCEPQVKLNEKDSTAQTIFLHAAKAA